ncbi:MAG: hydroxymethylbilane synthase [Chloroflexaceae bacterium]|jgi:hydroxymethylbilane synthase|nr:hydroxymethylbilane synthase [Chloroflexaceae bacterium]
MMAAALRAAHPGLEVELQIITTKGDKILDVALSAVGDKGLFVKELETALLEHQVDLAVHSGKDLPSLVPDGLTLAAFPPRADVRDVIVIKELRTENREPTSSTSGSAVPGSWFSVLPSGARVGTSSLRRAAQLRAMRPDLLLLDVRGNVDTRLRKLAEGQYDALVLAAAGLIRLQIVDCRLQINHERLHAAIGDQHPELQVLPIPPEVMLPAVAQGALAIECRADDAETQRLLSVLDDGPTRVAVLAERAFLRRLEGGCQVPIAAYATLDRRPETGDRSQQNLRSQISNLQLHGLVASLDGSHVVRGDTSGSPDEAERLGTALAERLLAEGAEQILAELRADASVAG